MSRRHPMRRAERGFTLTELLVSTAIMLTVTGAIFSLMNPAQGSAQAQPEVADMQQRMRVAADTLFKELVMAGAGTYQGQVRGSLINYFAPLLPRRTGRTSPDPSRGAGSFSSDKISIAYVPNTYSQTHLTAEMPDTSAELKVAGQSHCPQGQWLCGFKVGMAVTIFDNNGNFDNFTITEVQSAAGHLQHRGQIFSRRYPPNTSTISEINAYTYYLDRTTNQLRRYDGADSDVPIVDNVADLRFEYFGDPQPPRSPKPEPGVANCLYDQLGNYLNLPVLTATDGSLAALPASILTDGPVYCGGGTNEYDPDLLRIRKVRVTLRMQAATAAMRAGPDVTGTVRAGAGGERSVRDYILSFEVAPRNLNLGR